MIIASSWPLSRILIIVGMLAVLGIVCGISWVIGWYDRHNRR